jgi:spore photoproduct lyase
MHKHFSHIYVEEGIKEHKRTREILTKFKSSEIVYINHYKDVFNRRGQKFRTQKFSPKIILANRSDHFFYPGSHFSPNFNHPHFYYNMMALNCLYDCSYCYLQGLFSSANLVFFVNWEDYFRETDQFLEKNHSLYLALSYDTDLLATESFFPATKAWIEYAKERPSLELEIRTKSNQFSAIQSLIPIPNVILAWTISPENISREIEKKAPPLLSRLNSLQQAIHLGWKVRICIDPILRVKNWKEEYAQLVDVLAEKITLAKLYDISIGTFRMNSEFLGKIQSMRTDEALLYYPFARQSGIASYSASENEEMITFLRDCLKRRVAEEKIQVSY